MSTSKTSPPPALFIQLKYRSQVAPLTPWDAAFMNQTDGSRFLFLVAPAKERVKELVSKRKPGAALPPCVVRDAPSALLTMTYVHSIEKPPHPRPAPGRALRKPQRGCLEGRIEPPHPLPNPPPSRGRVCVGGEGLCQHPGGGPVSAAPFVLAPPRWGRVGVGVMRAECIDSVTAAAAIAALIPRC